MIVDNVAWQVVRDCKLDLRSIVALGWRYDGSGSGREYYSRILSNGGLQLLEIER